MRLSAHNGGLSLAMLVGLFAVCLPWGTFDASAQAAGDVLGVQAIEDPLIYYLRSNVRQRDPGYDDPVTVLLSKSVYPAEDGHLDAVLWLNDQEEEVPSGHLELTIEGPDGTEARGRVNEIPGRIVFLSMHFPSALHGQEGRLEVHWVREGEATARAEASFKVDDPAEVARSGRIAITVPNDTGASLAGAPMTAGVPFPRGALETERNVRLLATDGTEVPLQTRVTGRWSRFGPVRWLLCDFVADVEGESATFYLEYGPDIEREHRDELTLRERERGFPEIETGRLAIRPTGLYFDADGEGEPQRVLGPEAIHGGYVEHEDGRVYRMAPDGKFEVEEAGSEKVSVIARGYYLDGDGAPFCRFNTRYMFYRESPVVRIVHTWIFTGDGNRDRIRNMGWRFDLDADIAGEGALLSYEDPESWAQADYLVQHDFNQFDLVQGENARRDEKGRLPGVMAASGNGVRMMLGVKDFWQNFPSELEFADGAMYFHNWPRHGRAARHAPASPDDAIRLWFAHEGELLDFRLPEEFAEDPIWQQMSAGRVGSSHWLKGEPESANAQGVARTEEMWLYFTDEATPARQSVRALEGLDARTLHAMVDPAWVAASGAFYEIHHRDRENYPYDEKIYDHVAHAPARWAERIGLYGMWLHGETLWEPRLEERTASLYRALRKAHHGWPYSWVPFARSADPQLLKYAEAATRQMTDANFCHYVSDEVAERVASFGHHHRVPGWWSRSLVPWTGKWGPVVRSYEVKSRYLWDAYHLTGNRRARDVAEHWGELTKREDQPGRAGIAIHPGRVSTSVMKSYLDMYEATFDPWFLVAVHEIARMHREERSIRFWDTADRDFVRFSGHEEHRQAYIAYAYRQTNLRRMGWPLNGAPMIAPGAFGYHLTGDETLLRRAAAYVDRTNMSVYYGEPEHYKGFLAWDGSTSPAIMVGWYLQEFPLALGAFERAGSVPVPGARAFYQRAAHIERAEIEHDPDAGEMGYRYRTPTIAVKKEVGQALPLTLEVVRRAPSSDRGRRWNYRIVGPDGTETLAGSWGLGGGEWPPQVSTQVELPADAPAGTYRVYVEGVARRGPAISTRLFGLLIPISPEGTPEVIELEEGEPMGASVMESQYWFHVPEETGEFSLDIPLEPRYRAVRRMSIWNPERELVWDRQLPRGQAEDGSEDITARVEVPSEQAGRLWRLTLPGPSEGFSMDPRIPPVYAVSPDRWFKP